MESSVVINVQHVSKRFEIYRRSLDLLWSLVSSRVPHKEQWVLRDVSLQVQKGEIVGIVGQNGAGKSTLLKIITGTLQQTEGDVEVHGRVSSILELGTGFHPEYTGRENIFLNGFCLGMGKREIQSKLQRIINFSELEPVIDRPLKTYSTGMQARLAFSTSLAVDPQVFIVDEALSVGDVRFQRKCFAQFEEFRKAGCAILFVTHAPEMINAVCNRAIYLRDGVIVEDGPPKTVTGAYLKEMLTGKKGGPVASPLSEEDREEKAGYGTQEAKIIDVGFQNMDPGGLPELRVGERYVIYCRVSCQVPFLDDLHVGISIRTVHGVILFGINSVSKDVKLPVLQEGEVLEVRVPLTMWLAPGNYFLTFGAWGLKRAVHYDRKVDATHFRVSGECGMTAASLVNLEAEYEVARMSERASVLGEQAL